MKFWFISLQHTLSNSVEKQTNALLIQHSGRLRYFSKRTEDNLVGTLHTGDIGHAWVWDVDVQGGVVFVNESHSHVH